MPIDELEQTVTDINVVPEAYRSLYVEENGKFNIQVAVKGYKPEVEVQRVHAALVKERSDHAAAKTKLKPFEGLNIEEVQTQLARIPELELAAEGRIDDKKVDKIVEQRITQRLAPVQRERDNLKTQVEELTGVVTGFKQKDTQRTIYDAVRAAGGKQKVRDSAVEDILMVGERMLEVTEAGIVVKEGVGVTPGVSVEVWLQEMQGKRPHWWPDSVGGGAPGNQGGPGITTNPFSAEQWNLTQQGDLIRTNRSKAEQLAKAAGTTIGGGKPPPKK